MFTGIIRQLGIIKEKKAEPDGSVVLTIQTPIAKTTKEGDSIAVNGVCLTVLKTNQDAWQARLMHETLAKTNLGQVEKNHVVNLEEALRASDHIDGHFVQGHVDGTVVIQAITPKGNDKVFTFSLPKQLKKYIVPKGSISLNGVSLTIVNVSAESFTVSIMPYTIEHTTFKNSVVGDAVNIETDMFAKHIVAILDTYVAK